MFLYDNWDLINSLCWLLCAILSPFFFLLQSEQENNLLDIYLRCSLTTGPLLLGNLKIEFKAYAYLTSLNTDGWIAQQELA